MTARMKNSKHTAHVHQNHEWAGLAPLAKTNIRHSMAATRLFHAACVTHCVPFLTSQRRTSLTSDTATCTRDEPCKTGVSLGVFTLVTRGWAASEFLTCASKFNMTPNGEHQIIGLDRSHIFDAGVNFLTRASLTSKPFFLC